MFDSLQETKIDVIRREEFEGIGGSEERKLDRDHHLKNSYRPEFDRISSSKFEKKGH
jgi:hypothetical protein